MVLALNQSKNIAAESDPGGRSRYSEKQMKRRYILPEAAMSDGESQRKPSRW